MDAMKDTVVNVPKATDKVFDLNKCCIAVLSHRYVFFGTAL